MMSLYTGIYNGIWYIPLKLTEPFAMVGAVLDYQLFGGMGKLYGWLLKWREPKYTGDWWNGVSGLLWDIAGISDIRVIPIKIAFFFVHKLFFSNWNRRFWGT